MTNYRLVVQRHIRRWGSEGLEWEERWYILQQRSIDAGPWETVPTVDYYEDLSPAEQEECLKAHGFTKNPAGWWDSPRKKETLG